MGWGGGAEGSQAGVPALPCHCMQPLSPVPIALLAEDGNLVSLDEGLEEGASPAACMGSSLLQERGTYVLVRIISKWNTRVSLGAMKGGDWVSCPYPGLSPNLPPPNALVLSPAWPGTGDEMGIARVSQGSFTLSQPPQRGRARPPPAMSPSWRTWMSIPQSWQVSVKAEPRWGGHMSPQPLPTGGASWTLQRGCAGCQASLPRATAAGGA